MNKINKFFKLSENGTTVSKEFIAGLTTFFAMVYIIFVNPKMLENAGINRDAVLLATIFATVIGTLVMALFANVPYALAPGMGLNAFFTYVVCGSLGFNWKEGLALVFICGIINIIITVTKVRKAIIKAIPVSLQSAIGGGIGLFIAYIGIKNAGWLTFTADPGTWENFGGTVIADSSIVPAIADFNNPGAILAMIGLIITIILLLNKVKGALLLGIIITTLIGIPMGVANVKNIDFNLSIPFKALGETFFAAFNGMGTLFTGGISKILISLLAIFAFSLTDTFDTIGTFIGTGRKSGIFNDEDLKAVEESRGFKTRMEKALFADSIATSIGALLGTSNTTTYVESAAGIEAGGKTGLASVFTAVLFLLCIFIAPIIGIVPGQATAPALIIVGIMMTSSFKDINWHDFAEAIPAFFAAVVMAFAYNISIGIAFGFIFYIIVKVCKKESKEIHPILWGSSALFVLYFVLMALKAAKLI